MKGTWEPIETPVIAALGEPWKVYPGDAKKPTIAGHVAVHALYFPIRHVVDLRALAEARAAAPEDSR